MKNLGADKGLDITVAPNTTGQERTCTVNCHLTNSESSSPSPSEYITLPIAVTQEANALSPGEIAMQGILQCTFSAKVKMQDSQTGGISSTAYQQSFSSPNISYSQNGTTVHVDARSSYKEGQYDVYQSVISFDVLNFGGDFSSCSIANVQFQYAYSNNYVDWTQPGQYGKGDEIEAQLSNLRWQKNQSSYSEGTAARFTFLNTVGDGLTISKFTEKKWNYTDNQPTQNYSYVADGGNSASLTVEFQAKGSSASRRVTFGF